MNLTEQEFQAAFKNIKTNKSSGFDDRTSNVIISLYDHLFALLFHIFNIYIHNV